MNKCQLGYELNLEMIPAIDCEEESCLNCSFFMCDCIGEYNREFKLIRLRQRLKNYQEEYNKLIEDERRLQDIMFETVMKISDIKNKGDE